MLVGRLDELARDIPCFVFTPPHVASETRSKNVCIGIGRKSALRFFELFSLLIVVERDPPSSRARRWMMWSR